MPQTVKNKRIIFLDRDGVINRELDGYLTEWSSFEFLPDALDSLKFLKENGWTVIVITNQSAIGRGYATTEAIDEIMAKMIAEVQASGGDILDVIYCPHTPEDGCICRKPKSDLFYQAAEKHRIDLSDKWYIGDKLSDVEAAISASLKPILIRGGKVVTGISVTEDDAVAVVNNLSEAIEFIMEALKVNADA